MVVVGEQHGVERAEVVRRDGRAGELGRRRPPPERVVPPGRVEGRVGEQPPARHLDEQGGPADVREADH